MLRTLPVRAARGLIFVYRVSFSALAGRACRHLPSCSEFADEAIRRHGLWAGGWMSMGRICRCRPGGTEGFDPAPVATPRGAGPLTPWRYAKWRGPLVCDAVEPAASSQDRAISSTARP
jgi:putative membrane protein insertion efficiency factor